jgi:hypothetical protein
MKNPPWRSGAIGNTYLLHHRGLLNKDISGGGEFGVGIFLHIGKQTEIIMLFHPVVG